ncbi:MULTISPECIES: Der GTPase-activating protein YihI [Gammaproteobacteria]|uniref:Der GTPase-activating protein YihI n=1 Tax=Gammaproteobacteria TaxID=1236 RepID=UPI000DD0442B|nr:MULTISPECIES: Der GTPase-activating protein YihI [Gammaproteobacteria]RTE86654.1 GTPase-activating protein [Aliidiomarina sp. B3213]TCZ90791.1 GTPase-activating protein [Lysobacter sp. N42]
MTRRKKTRKTGPLAARSQPKMERQREEGKRGKEPARTKGKPAGQRHTLDVKENSKAGKGHGTNSKAQEDPRKGSKRPVELVKPVRKTAEQVEDVTPANPQEALEFEFEALENDPVLQELLDQIDEGEQLSAEDQQFVDEQMTRYQELVELLGIEDNELDEDDA